MQTLNDNINNLNAIKNKVTVVTNGANKTGRAIVERLAETGARIIVADINLINAEVVVQAITDKFKAEASAITWKASEGNAVDSTLKTIHDSWGEIDIWINTSHMLHQAQVIESSESGFYALVEKNCREVFNHCRAVASYMKASKIKGIIINVMPCLKFKSLKGSVESSDTDQYISNETKILSEELLEYGIRIFTIAPVPPQEIPWDNINGNQELGFTRADDAARLVIFCISILSKNMTGKLIRLSGKKIFIEPQF